MSDGTTVHRVGATYSFPVEGLSTSSPPLGNVGDTVAPAETHVSDDGFPIVQARAGNITARPIGADEANVRLLPSPTQQPLQEAMGFSTGTIPGASASVPSTAHMWNTNRGSVASSYGHTPGRKSTSYSATSRSLGGGGSRRNSPAPRGLIAYIHGSTTTTDTNDDDDGEAKQSFDTAGADAEEMRGRLCRNSILSHTRRRLSPANGAGSLVNSTGSARATPQLMYRQDCVEEVTRMSPVASEANSPCSTPRVQSRRVSSPFHVGGGAIAIDEGASHRYLPAGAGGASAAGTCSASRPATPPPHGPVGVSTPEMAEYFADTATHAGASFPSEMTVNSTFVMQKCLRAVQEQARAIQVLQNELHVMERRNRLLEERVLHLERVTGSRQNDASAAADEREGVPSEWSDDADEPGERCRKENEEKGGDEEKKRDASGVGRGSGSPSVTRPSDTLSDEHCSTRAPSKAV